MINSSYEKYNSPFRILRVLATQDYLACDEFDQYFILSSFQENLIQQDSIMIAPLETLNKQSYQFIIFSKNVIEIEGLKLQCFPIKHKQIQWIRNIPILKIKSVPFVNKILINSIKHILVHLLQFDFKVIKDAINLKNFWIYKEQAYLFLMKRQRKIRISLNRSEKRYLNSEKSCGFNQILSNQLNIIKEFALLLWDALFDACFYTKNDIQNPSFARKLLKQMIKKEITFEQIMKLINYQQAKNDALKERKKHRCSLLVRRHQTDGYFIKKDNYTEKIKKQTIQTNQPFLTPAKKLSTQHSNQRSENIYQRYQTQAEQKPRQTYLKSLYSNGKRRNSILQQKQFNYRRNSLGIQQIIDRQSFIAKERYNRTLQVRDDDKIKTQEAQMRVRQLCKTISSKNNSKSQEKVSQLQYLNSIRNKMFMRRVSVDRSLSSATEHVNIHFSKKDDAALPFNSETTPIGKIDLRQGKQLNFSEKSGKQFNLSESKVEEEPNKSTLKKKNEKLRLFSYVYRQYEKPIQKNTISQPKVNSSTQIENNDRANNFTKQKQQQKEIQASQKRTIIEPPSQQSKQPQKKQSKSIIQKQQIQIPYKSAKKSQIKESIQSKNDEQALQNKKEIKKPPTPKKEKLINQKQTIDAKQDAVKKSRKDKPSNYQDEEIEQIVFKQEPKPVIKPSIPQTQTNKKPEVKSTSPKNKSKPQPLSDNLKEGDLQAKNSAKKSVSKQNSVQDLIDQFLTLINIIGDICVKAVKMKDKLKVLEWKLGSFFLYERFLYERKKIEKYLQTSEKFSRAHRKISAHDWEEWLKLPSRKTLLTAIQHQNTIIQTTLKKLGNRILQECKLQRKVQYYIRNRENIEQTMPQKIRGQLSKYITKSIADQYDEILEKGIKDPQIISHIMDAVFGLRIVAELDGKIKKGDPQFAQINQYKQYRYSFQQMDKTVDFIYDLYFPQVQP